MGDSQAPESENSDDFDHAANMREVLMRENNLYYKKKKIAEQIIGVAKNFLMSSSND